MIKRNDAIATLTEEMGIVPEQQGAEAYAPRANGNGHARQMLGQLGHEDVPTLARELATKLMDSANISADDLTEVGNLLRACGAEMRAEGQQIADHLVDYDRRRETLHQFAASIRAFINDTRMSRQV